MSWSNPRDIALIFLSLQALVMALIPLVLLAGLAYAVHRVRPVVRRYLRLAFVYAEQGRRSVENITQRITAPFIRVHSTICMTQTILRQLTVKK
ncbi:MAG TPA: hypothetical protein PLQ85_14300 [Anaerolineae bacterium]|nr:hypothetical protein [Anaerolineae bacterium]HQE99146.1 hypothetical protein [Anaerolineae bacterium]HQJ11846.1 hypothetical protein [Anaerolineae bacterium]HUM38039.1 hypothetical protein [Anaerolineae bacterium]